MIYENKFHAGDIIQQLWFNRENDVFCDVVLIAGTEIRIPAHSYVLSASSKYFREIFRSRDRASTEVKFPDVDGDILKLLICFCYTGSIEIKMEIVEKLIPVAELLCLDVVVDACGNFIAKQLHPTNCLGFALLAEKCDLPKLLKQANDYTLEYFMDVCKTDEFLNLNAERLGQLLANDHISVSAEEDIFNAVILWLQHDQVERQNNKDELLKLVRMPLLDQSFLIENVKPVCISTDCLQFYTEAMEQNNAGNSTKSRRSYQFLMSITESTQNRSGICMHYYNQGQNKWMKWLQDLEYRLGFEIAVIDDNIYIVGGFDARGEFLNTVISLNFRTMDTSEVNPMKEQRAVFGVAVLKGSLYALGGWAGHYMNSVEKWDLKTNKWNDVAPMSVNRSNFGVAVLDEKLYVVGGASDSSPLNSAECYDPHQNVWKSIAPMNESRTHLGVAVSNGLLYAVGGYQKNTVERYDPEANSWIVICSLNDNLVGSRSCTTFRDKIIVYYSDRAEEYNVATNEWTVNSALKGLANIYCIFSYADKLLISEFAEN